MAFFEPEPPDFETDGRDWPHRDKSRFVLAGGVNWHVQDFGAPRPDAPVLLLVHGTGGATHSFRDLAPLLASEWHVIMPDLPNHGFTRARDDDALSLPGMARAMKALLLALKLTPALAAGHSAGAAVLIRMALQKGFSPRAIIGFNAALLPFRGFAQKLFPAIARLLVLNPLAPRIAAFTATESAVERLLSGTGSKIDPRGLELYQRLFAKPGHCAGALGMMARWDLETLLDDLPRLTTRLDLVSGSRDKTVPPEDAAELKRKHSAIILHTMAGLGHLAHEEDPAEAARLINLIAASAP